MEICICGRRIEGRSTRCSRCAALHEIGLEDGATEAEIKEAYRAHVKAWHPDRYADDYRQLREAERKLKKVNAAYNLLTSTEAIPETISGPWPQSAPEPEPQEPPDSGSKRFKPALIYVMLFVAIVAATYFLSTEQLKSPLGRHSGSTAAISAVAGASGTAQQAQAPPALPEFFTLGSAKSDVIAVEGQPTSQDDSVFHYGLSTVSFENDLVVGWMVFPLNPLKVRLLPATQSDTGRGYFSAGSSRDDVLALQGTPTSVADGIFRYGRSSVTFQDDKVSTWSVNPANPLHVRESR